MRPVVIGLFVLYTTVLGLFGYALTYADASAKGWVHANYSPLLHLLNLFSPLSSLSLSLPLSLSLSLSLSPSFC